VLFESPRSIEDLISAKSHCIDIEARFSVGKSRQFNLNPGVFHEGFLFMASHKDGPRRAQLSPRVWIEPQLRTTKLAIRGVPWSFEEFRSSTTLTAIQRECARIANQSPRRTKRASPTNPTNFALAPGYVRALKETIASG
ncbi:MAG: DUF4416 family protein, partial [Verrucomicrobia bacterium]|nr:DUF4416 family protein [Verrucomicrobiota bacterium]